LPAFVTEARLVVPEDEDPAAVGAAVTTALCGHWEHKGPCRWPHNNEISAAGDAFELRTLYLAADAEQDEAHDRIERALRAQGEWTVLRCGQRPVSADERALAKRLAAAPRRLGTSEPEAV
jgi:hypothetical protein